MSYGFFAASFVSQAPTSTPSLVKQTNAITTSGTSATGSFASATTSGNLIVYCVGVDKNGGSWTGTGWNVLYSLPSTSTSLYFGWRVSTGQTSFNTNWTTSTSGATLWMGEYEDLGNPDGTWSIVGQASNITSEASVTSTSTGTTGTLSAAGLGIACASIDTAQNFTSPSWSNSYVSRYIGNSGSARGGVLVAEKLESAGITTSSTVSWTTADQVSAAIAVFAKV